ncbi:MFS transporter [Metarhizium robertsii]|uniref:Phthalate transporter n=2 Tax=Metarhizium robertsii TaxID=568076 RepID=E9F5S2_METRA|nr:phthalate transporter [Metarhizium robertsii ARSEF 23]EFY96808.2 phthalate transporter [Metarhizium robertsii ARSEF 23]EXU99808.1 MFS transporter [Metarhizium robertsii]
MYKSNLLYGCWYLYNPLRSTNFPPLSPFFYTNPAAIDHGKVRVCKLPHRKANCRAVSPGPARYRRRRGVLASGTKEDHPAHVGSSFLPWQAQFPLLPRQRLMKSSDLRLVTVLACLYVISLVDRVNISTAAVAHLNSDLALQTGARYSIVISAFFITYTVFQPLGTVLTRKIGPRWFLSSIAMAWGLVMIGNGFVHSWQTLAGLRVLIGVFEAGYFPGAVYLLSTWYTRFDMQKRYTVFYGVGCVAGALGGILAFGLSQMNGLGGLRGWRWIFIIEGILSCVGALVSYAFLVGFPEEADQSWNFITRQERDFIIRRVNRDRGDAVTEPFSLGAFLAPAADFKIWIFAFIFFCVTTVGYSINFFLPMILLGMGFSVAESQCLIVPPWVFTGLVMYAQAWLGDRYRLRGPIIAFNAVLALVGLMLMAFHHAYPVRYTGVFFVVAGASGNTPPVLTYQANNIRGHWKRAFCSATLVGFGGIGGIAGALVFRSQDQPRYLPGIYASIACNVCILLCTGGLSIWFWYSNQKVKRGKAILEGLEGFTYTY